MREAENRYEICESILQNTGIDLEIISGKEEAKLIFSNFHLWLGLCGSVSIQKLNITQIYKTVIIKCL